MANAIYTTTRDGLADLVSRQVAERVLARAVADVGSEPDVVDASTMSRLLRGPVRRELERTLPRAGVRRQLARLDAHLKRERADAKRPPAAEAAAPVSAGGSAPPTGPSAVAPQRRPVAWRREPADVASETERRRAFPIAGDPELSPPDVPPSRPTPSRPTRRSTASTPPSGGTTRAKAGPATASAVAPTVTPTPRRGAGPAAAAPVARPAVRARPDRLIERIAERDAVRSWVWSPKDGEPEGRGTGPEPARVAAGLAPLVTVLGLHGRLRSLHVRHGRGHVLIGADRGSTLVVAGDDALNLGSIYATFRALEEEP